jgi:transcription elongation factor Elf1
MARRDDDDDDDRRAAKGRQLYEFDCPGCNANNPWPDGFRDRDEITCHYCGVSYTASISDEGKLKLKEY